MKKCNNCGKSMWFWRSGICSDCANKEKDFVKGFHRHKANKKLSEKAPKIDKHLKGLK